MLFWQKKNPFSPASLISPPLISLRSFAPYSLTSIAPLSPFCSVQTKNCGLNIWLLANDSLVKIKLHIDFVIDLQLDWSRSSCVSVPFWSCFAFSFINLVSMCVEALPASSSSSKFGSSHGRMEDSKHYGKQRRKGYTTMCTYNVLYCTV